MKRDSLDNRIEAQTVARYSARFREHGISARSLGWGTTEHQRIRFGAACGAADLAGLEVLDFGCGFGDLLAFLQERGNGPERYVGIDLVPEFVAVARDRHPRAEIFQGLDEFLACARPTVDIAVALGVMNFRQTETGNLDYAASVLDRLWPLVRQGVVVDFLSAHWVPDYPAEDWVYYYEPADIIALARRYTPLWSLKHDYPAIPQREMMLWMQKQ